MKSGREIKGLVKKYLDKEKIRKIKRIKDKDEKRNIFHHTLITNLKLKHLNLDIAIKKVQDRKTKHLLSLKSNIISPKIMFLQTNFNEKDFKKIDSLIEKLKEEISNV